MALNEDADIPIQDVSLKSRFQPHPSSSSGPKSWSHPCFFLAQCPLANSFGSGPAFCAHPGPSHSHLSTLIIVRVSCLPHLPACTQQQGWSIQIRSQLMLQLRTKLSSIPLVKHQFLQWPVRAYIICHPGSAMPFIIHTHTHIQAVWLVLHHFASATPASLLFLKHAKCTLASRPFHLIFPLPDICSAWLMSSFPSCPHSSQSPWYPYTYHSVSTVLSSTWHRCILFIHLLIACLSYYNVSFLRSRIWFCSLLCLQELQHSLVHSIHSYICWMNEWVRVNNKTNKQYWCDSSKTLKMHIYRFSPVLFL